MKNNRFLGRGHAKENESNGDDLLSGVSLAGSLLGPI
jgi:hypothetical protein